MSALSRSVRRRQYLLCPPVYFDVRYSINPWMDTARPTSAGRALSQWYRLYDTLADLGHAVHQITPVPGLPDMVFAANGAIVADGRALVARFRYPQRAAEAAAYLDWFRLQGYQDVRQAAVTNEGEGDFLTAGKLTLAGRGFRSDPGSHDEVREFFGNEVLSLTLVDPRFYHLDTALAVLDDEEVMYLPQAFSPESRELLADRYPDAVLASLDEACLFGLNAVSDGLHVLMPPGATRLAAQLRDRGYEPIGIDTTELLKAGGGAKCCTLELRDGLRLFLRYLPTTRRRGQMTMSPPANAIEVAGLRKSFGKQTVLDGISLEVPAGTVFSLLGPNGAGKTTTVQILTTLIRSDGGRVMIAGHDVAKESGAVRAAIGVTGQFSAVDKLLSGEENLLMMADLAHLGKQEGRARTAALLERFDLVDAAKKLAMNYSGGMKRRLDLAMSLLGRPEIIFLDEPTTGLDPRSRRTMWQIVQELVKEGTTVFLTTQALDEADHLADRIAMLDRGKLVAEGTPQELKKLVHGGGHVTLMFADAHGLDAALRALGDLKSDRQLLSVEVPSDGSVASLKNLLDKLGDEGIEVSDLSLHSPDLNDVFFALTDRSAGQPAEVTDTKKATV